MAHGAVSHSAPDGALGRSYDPAQMKCQATYLNRLGWPVVRSNWIMESKMDTEIAVRAIASPQELVGAKRSSPRRFLTTQAPRWPAIVPSPTVRIIPNRRI